MAKIAEMLAARADRLLRVLPAEVRSRREGAGRGARGPHRALAQLRLGHVRRRRHHPRAHPRPGVRIDGERPSRPWPTSPASATPATSWAILESTATAGSRTSSPSPATRRPTAADAGRRLHLRRRARRADRRGGRVLGRRRRPPRDPPPPPDRASDRRHLAAKLAAADFAVTQFFFEAEHYFRLVDELAALGVTKPVLPGVMPVTNLRSVSRMAQLSGAASAVVARWRGSDAVDGDPEAGAQGRRRGRHRAVQDLSTTASPGLHLYTLNRSSSIREVYAGLGW